MTKSSQRLSFDLSARQLIIPMMLAFIVLAGCRAESQETEVPKAKADSQSKDATPATQEHEGHRPALPSADVIAKLPKDGGKKFNRLVFESSPYLLQHARNEVDWYPWGPLAFEKAKQENKAVFLSVGYSTCHWCHVMERESFENAAVAALMNKHFVCIKVDREERPDVDKIYMAAVQAQTGRGGWPMSVFMTADRKPFWSGTYFPPEDRGGRPGFKTVLTHLAKVYKDKPTEVDEHASAILEQLKAMAQSPEKKALNKDSVLLGLTHSKRSYDPVHGGFGRAPKFPRSHGFSYLLRIHRRNQDVAALNMVTETLRHMAQGGLQDHLGGGFHRYSTDREWLVPHFEKMLYDQALLARSYIEAFQVSGDARHAETARSIFNYVARDMTAPEGGFYSAEDADSEGEEGKFYVWTRDEIMATLGETAGKIFCRVYNITDEGNFKDEATGKKTGANILHLTQNLDALADLLKDPSIKTGKDLEARLAPMRATLFALRKKRIHPLKDDKILTDWNGLMISSLAYSGKVLGNDRDIKAATRAAEFITKTMVKKGRLLHRYRGGDAAIKAYLDDYAFLSLGLLDLFEATSDSQWLEQSLFLAREMLRLYWDKESAAFHFSAIDSEGLITSTKSAYDGAVPSGNSVGALVLLRLGHLTGDKALTKAGQETIEHFSGQLAQSPTAHPFMMMALDFSLGPMQEIVLCGDPRDPRLFTMRWQAERAFRPRRCVILRPDGPLGSALEALVPHVKNRGPLGGKATAYVCEDSVCQLPTSDFDKFIELMR